MSEVDDQLQNEPTIQSITQEIKTIRQDLRDVVEMMQDTQRDLRRLINVFNERVTHLYGEIDHLAVHGPAARYIPQRKIIVVHDYFTHG